MASDWEEVKRLAADFQRAQLSDAVQRLSERNCVEIVNKLVEKNLIEIFFTTDGKEYVTPQHLLQEIRDELFVSGGRIHLSELSQILCVDYAHVENKATELVHNERNTYLVLGQLIESTYVDRLFEEINEKLQQQGQITTGELAKHHDLPPEFLQQMMKERVGTIIHGQIDPRNSHVVFTEEFISRHRARICGALIAATRPVQVNQIINRYGLQEQLFFAILTELINAGQLKGHVAGGRSEKTASYIPDIYAKSQNDWVDSFYKLNNYFEFDVMVRMGIGDPQGFIRKRFKQEPLIFLSSCAIGQLIVDQIEAGVEDAISGGSWVDVATLCPSFFSANDIQQILQAVFKKSKQAAALVQFCDTIVASNMFIQGLLQPFQPIMATMAEEANQKGLIIWKPTSAKGASTRSTTDAKKDRKEERRKKAGGGKSGGGTQGRETKTKAVKKKYGKGGRASDDSDDEKDVPSKCKGSGGEPGTDGGLVELPFLNAEEIHGILKDQPTLDDCPSEFVTELSEFLEKPLKTKFQEVTHSVFMNNVNSGATLRKSHDEVQEKVNMLVTNVRFFEQGIVFTDEETKDQLLKYLLKTVCSDITSLIVGYVAQENMISVDEKTNASPEARQRLLAQFPDGCREVLEALNSTLFGKSINDFFEALKVAVGPEVCGIKINKFDKKQKSKFLAARRTTLEQQLTDANEPALVLHLTSLILYQAFTSNLLHASGKFVPQTINFLKNYMNSDGHQLLLRYQGLVIKQLTTAGPKEKLNIQNELKQLMTEVKEVVLSSKCMEVFSQPDPSPTEENGSSAATS